MAFFDGCELSAVATDAFVELIKPFPVIVHPPVAFGIRDAVRYVFAQRPHFPRDPTENRGTDPSDPFFLHYSSL